MHSPKPTQAQSGASLSWPRVACALALLGLIWQSALVYGIAQFLFLMAQTFVDITESGAADPKVMAVGIGRALTPVVFWGSVGSFGLAITAVTLIVSQYRARWFFWSSSVFAVLYLLFPPIGTLASVGLIVVLVIKRNEFFSVSPTLEGNRSAVH